MNTADSLLDHHIQLPDRRPGNHKVLCPECSHTRKNRRDPCLSVSIDDDGGAVWNCHNCGWKGGTKNSRHAEYTRRPKRAYRRPPADYEGTKNEALYSWFAKRGISAKTVDAHGVTFRRAYIPAKKGQERAIAFPYYRGAELIGVKYRTTDKSFAQEKDAEPIWYGLNDIQGCDTAVIVEGELDKLAFSEAGMANVISVPNGAPGQLKDEVPNPENDANFAFLHNCAGDLAHIERFVIAVDNDDPGHVLAEELARRLGKERCWRVTWPTLNDTTVKDANDCLLAHPIRLRTY